MKLSFTVSNLNEYKSVIYQLQEKFVHNKIFLLDAPMGAGKTTFIKEFCKVLGSSGNFSSPTFSIVNEYLSAYGKIFHFDLYRIENEKELIQIGFDEYLNGKNYCFIEWPEKAIGFLKGEEVVWITIKPTENESRQLTAEVKKI